MQQFSQMPAMIAQLGRVVSAVFSFPRAVNNIFLWKRLLQKKQFFFEAETLAAVVAFLLWSPEFVNRRCVLFVDNEGTKFSLLRGLSENKVVDFIAEKFVGAEAAIHAFT